MLDATPLPSLQISLKTQQDLGFLDIQNIISSLCHTSYAKELFVEQMFPATHGELNHRLDEAIEARTSVERRSIPDFGAVREIRHLLSAVDKEVVLGSLDVLEVARTLDGLARIRDLLDMDESMHPLLSKAARHIGDERRFARRLLRAIDDEGNITDDASAELASLRGRMRHLRNEAQEQLERLVREYDDEGYLRDRNFTLRNDRYVLPVKAEQQRHVEGIVHDASQTGQTVFVEPRAILNIGNRIKIARAEIIEEEQRILREFSQAIQERADAIRADLRVAALLEAAFARGKLADAIDGNKPRFARRFMLHDARHPLLLWRSHQSAAAGGARPRVVGNDMGFGHSRVLIITGPNAGGKTVALKTMGLVAMMARAGIPVPVAPSSEIPFYAAIFSTVGDAQSIDDALSSFSGHLVALREILQSIDDIRQKQYAERQAERLAAGHAEQHEQHEQHEHENEHEQHNPRAIKGDILCLLDELLSGTDPAQGAVLAQSYLEELVSKGVYTVATTHYERLKALAFIDAAAVADSKVAESKENLDAHGPANPDDTAQAHQHANQQTNQHAQNTTNTRRGRHQRKHPIYRNASVALEQGSGKPTFVLYMDKAGVSGGLQAARRYGLPENLVARAETMLAPDDKNLHALINQLSEQQRLLEDKLKDAENEKQKWAKESRRLEKRLQDVERESQRLRKEGAKAFLHELNEARRIVGEATKMLQGGGLDAKSLNKLSHQLQEQEQSVEKRIKGPSLVTPEEAVSLLAPKEVKVGETYALLEHPGNKFVVQEVDGDEVVLSKGILRMRAKKSSLRLPEDDTAKLGSKSSEKNNDAGKQNQNKAKQSPRLSRYSYDGYDGQYDDELVGQPKAVPAAVAEPKTSENTLDLRGKYAEEALELVDAFLDKLLREERQRAFILHGHGTGALKRAVRAHLQSSRYAKKYGPAEHDDGGDAFTLVELR